MYLNKILKCLIHTWLKLRTFGPKLPRCSTILRHGYSESCSIWFSDSQTCWLLLLLLFYLNHHALYRCICICFVFLLTALGLFLCHSSTACLHLYFHCLVSPQKCGHICSLLSFVWAVKVKVLHIVVFGWFNFCYTMRNYEQSSCGQQVIRQTDIQCSFLQLHVLM